MLVASCCGASTFAFDFTRLIARAEATELYTTYKELRRGSSRAQIRPVLLACSLPSRISCFLLFPSSAGSAPTSRSGA
jgi:hypothetical protein